MAWIIVKDRDNATRFLIKDTNDMAKGEIVTPASSGQLLWEVNLLMVPDLTFRNDSFDQCIGYVHGVEATVNLYAKETRDVKEASATRRKRAQGRKR